MSYKSSKNSRSTSSKHITVWACRSAILATFEFESWKVAVLDIIIEWIYDYKIHTHNITVEFLCTQYHFVIWYFYHLQVLWTGSQRSSPSVPPLVLAMVLLSWWTSWSCLTDDLLQNICRQTNRNAEQCIRAKCHKKLYPKWYWNQFMFCYLAIQPGLPELGETKTGLTLNSLSPSITVTIPEVQKLPNNLKTIPTHGLTEI